mmetsp:Transcript_20692/g.42031  ORF Transcript_20692/g.42031 Transcript_20692/m.42031 type:complete len:303 (-) Transcript_20692:35-943(-)|eukprot:CAMPEP_0181312282 /NCGR_PEP_ID=MMETSP1101-20121128/13612_1 /TAXON_ID=46948 /ORGANISM="Rhodomonas abbreviata, Strain Caron Lab Isolate" /LENGTH=302 /DNA_ID=CAMNT_0023419119 /DNA_START=104 /DNA_END=1012 /DNA_ORIENTATION=+
MLAVDSSDSSIALPPFGVLIQHREPARSRLPRLFAATATAFGLICVIFNVSSKSDIARSELLFSSKASPWSDVPLVIKPEFAARSAVAVARQEREQKLQAAVGHADTLSYAPLVSNSHTTTGELALPSLHHVSRVAPPTVVRGVARPFLAMPFEGHFPHQSNLPQPSIGNGLNLGYYSLSNLPATTAVQFAQREMQRAHGVLHASNGDAPSAIDSAAESAYQSGTRVVIRRREADGIMPKPLSPGDVKSPNVDGSTMEDAGGNVAGNNESEQLERELAAANQQVGALEKRLDLLHGEDTPGR